MEKAPNHLLKVSRNMYLSRYDERFLEKYLRFFPDDPVKLYDYAGKLEKEGQILKAIGVYEKAARCGSPAARKRLQELTLLGKRMEREKLQLLEREHRAKRLLTAAILLFLFALFLFAETKYGVLGKVFHLREIEHHYYEREVIHHPPKERIIVLPEESTAGEEESLHAITPAEELPDLVVQNALYRYREEHGRLPGDVSELAGKYPDNWLSFIPGGSGAARDLSSRRGDLSDGKASHLLELHYYPQTRQLAVVRDREVLALYPVAAGKTPLPFDESRVINRIVNPNGGKGALGSRGLELQDGYAIHGTDEPSSIGAAVTGGCLRLRNEDIEVLYPYIAKGTPFKVKGGTPPSPTFPSGLPPLGPLADPGKEENPAHRFLWRG